MLIENVVIKDARQGYCKATLMIVNGRIADIVITDDNIHGAEFYVTPGFVNSHLHPNQLSDRRLLDELNITELLDQMHGVYKKTDEERYTHALLVLMEAIKAGATTIYGVANHPFPAIRAFKALGIKGAVSCFYNDQWEGYGAPPVLSTLEGIKEHFAHAFSEQDERVKIHIGASSVESTSNDLLLLLNELASHYNTKVNLHVSEGVAAVNSCRQSRATTPVRLLSELGVLDSKWNLIHAVTVDDEEIERIAYAKASVIHCPVSNAKTGVGIAPIRKMREKGIQLALGSDACSNNNTNNVLNEAYVAALLQCAIQQDPRALPVEVLMQWLTTNGHQVVGTGQKGALSVGEPADLLLWSLKESAFVPLIHERLDAALIYNAPDLKPHTVLIDGKPVVENYRFTLIPEHTLYEAANACGFSLCL